MVKEAKLVNSFETRDTSAGTELTVMRSKPWAYATATLASFPLLLIILFGLIGGPNGSSFFYPALAAAVLGVIWYWATRRKAETVVFGREGLIARDKLYRYENIKYVGFKNPSGGHVSVGSGVAHSVGAAAGGAMATVAYYVHITHGTKEVAILRGLTEHEVQPVYDEVVRVLATKGQRFG